MHLHCIGPLTNHMFSSIIPNKPWTLAIHKKKKKKNLKENEKYELLMDP